MPVRAKHNRKHANHKNKDPARESRRSVASYEKKQQQHTEWTRPSGEGFAYQTKRASDDLENPNFFIGGALINRLSAEASELRAVAEPITFQNGGKFTRGSTPESARPSRAPPRKPESSYEQKQNHNTERRDELWIGRPPGMPAMAAEPEEDPDQHNLGLVGRLGAINPSEPRQFRPKGLAYGSKQFEATEHHGYDYNGWWETRTRTKPTDLTAHSAYRR